MRLNRPPNTEPYITRFEKLLAKSQRARDAERANARLRRLGQRHQLQVLQQIRAATRVLDISFEELVSEAITAAGNPAWFSHRPLTPPEGWPRRSLPPLVAKALRSPSPLDRLAGLRLELNRCILHERQLLSILQVIELAPLLGTTFAALCAEANLRYQSRFH